MKPRGVRQRIVYRESDLHRHWATLRHAASAANASMRPTTKPLAFTDNATIARMTNTTNAESETTSSVASALRFLSRLAAMAGRYTRARTGLPLDGSLLGAVAARGSARSRIPYRTLLARSPPAKQRCS